MWAVPRGRSGIRLRGERGHPVVRKCLIRYAAWLRANYEFPIRLPVYLLPGKDYLTVEGQVSEVSFFAPINRRHEPYIRIATGAYPMEAREIGRDNALAAYICAVSRQIVHYQQWISTGRVHNRGVDRQAAQMLRRYRGVTQHP
jgi:hypothetical protein